VAKELQSWASKKIGNVKAQLLLAKEEIEMRREIKGLCLGLVSLERTIARQRSRITYLREGDANTCFFHLHVLEAGGARTTDHEGMAAMLKNYYDMLLGQDLERETTINFVALDIVQQDLASLKLPFTKEEVWQIIKEPPSDKSPGPDDMTGAFYKTAWPVVKDFFR
jgi:hypothetical protein